jgi:hypothetical protein
VKISRKGIRSLQNYSETGAWGPVLHPDADNLRVPWPSSYRAGPLVCQGAIHWPCSISNNAPDYSSGDEQYLTHTVAVDITTGRSSKDYEATKAVFDAQRRCIGQENAHAGYV